MAKDPYSMSFEEYADYVNNSGGYDKPPIRGRDALMGAARDARDSDFGTSKKSRTREVILSLARAKLPISVEDLMEVGIDPNNPRELKRFFGSDNWVKVGETIEYKSKAKIKTKLGEPDLPTSAIGGGTITGRGSRGALFGEDVRRELAEVESRRAAQQEATILGAQARLRGMGAQATTTSFGAPAQPVLSEPGRLLEEMKAKIAAEKEQVAIFGKGRRTGRSMAERNFAKWQMENPAAAMELELRMSQEERLSRQAQSKEERAAQAVELRRRIAEEVKSGKYDPEIIAVLNELKSESYKEGTDVETIFLQAQAIFESATKERSRNLQEQLDKEKRQADEWDRRRDRTEAFSRESSKLAREAQAMAAEVASGRADRRTFDQNKFKLESEIRRIQAEIAESEPFVNDTPAGQNAKAYVEGLRNSLAIIEDAYTSFSAGGQAAQRTREQFIAQFKADYGRAPTETELQKARNKYWF